MLTLMQVSQGHVQDNPSPEFNQANGSSAPGACPHSPASPPLRTQGQLGPQRRELTTRLLRRAGVARRLAAKAQSRGSTGM